MGIRSANQLGEMNQSRVRTTIHTSYPVFVLRSVKGSLLLSKDVRLDERNGPPGTRRGEDKIM